jgi:GTP-binding protein
MVYLGDYRSFVIADIPGLIEGASEGKGLGHRFLKHVERNAVLLFCLPADVDAPAEQFDVLVRELAAYSPELLDKPRLAALTKMDLVPVELHDEWVADVRSGLPNDLVLLPVSAVARWGLDELKERLFTEVTRSRAG